MPENFDIKVSVIMPVYNAAAYLAKTLDSVREQTLQEIEIICVDDGSTDESAQILEQYAEKDPRFHILHQKNQYAGVARNTGLKTARGKYVIFWDSDDFFKPYALERLYVKAEEDQADICICGAYKYDELTDQAYADGAYLYTPRLPEQTPFAPEQMGEYLFNFCANVPWNKLYLRSFIEEKGLAFQPVRQANDAYFILCSLFYAARITYVRAKMIYYRITEDGLTKNARGSDMFVVDALRATLSTLEKEERFTAEFRRSFDNKLLGVMIQNIRRMNTPGDVAQVMEAYRDSVIREFSLDEHEDSYYYNSYNTQYLRTIMTGDLQQLLFEMIKNAERQMVDLRVRSTDQKEALIRQEKAAKKTLNQQMKLKDKEIASLEKNIASLEKRISTLEESTSYKLGRTLTAPVRYVKDRRKNE